MNMKYVHGKYCSLAALHRWADNSSFFGWINKRKRSKNWVIEKAVTQMQHNLPLRVLNWVDIGFGFNLLQVNTGLWNYIIRRLRNSSWRDWKIGGVHWMVVSTGTTILADSMTTVMCTHRLILGGNMQMRKDKLLVMYTLDAVKSTTIFQKLNWDWVTTRATIYC